MEMYGKEGRKSSVLKVLLHDLCAHGLCNVIG